MSQNPSGIHCSFCGNECLDAKLRVDAVHTPTASICLACIRFYAEQTEKSRPPPVWPRPLTLPSSSGKATKRLQTIDLPSPRKIVEHLDRFVMGQDEAKRVLASSVYDHYLRVNTQIKNGKRSDQPVPRKRNVLMLGPSGCGKTFLIKTVAELLKVPFCEYDASQLTPTGWYGDDAETILTRLFEASGQDRTRSEYGIVFLDEIDKIGAGQREGRVLPFGIQHSLLKMVEGGMFNMSSMSNQQNNKSPSNQLDSTHILFVGGGVFATLPGIVSKRLGDHTLGFDTGMADRVLPSSMPLHDRHSADHLERLETENRKQTELNRAATTQDFVKLGFLTEFSGRFPRQGCAARFGSEHPAEHPVQIPEQPPHRCCLALCATWRGTSHHRPGLFNLGGTGLH